MLTKEQVSKTVNELPEEFTLDELIDRLILLDKIERGLKDSAAGNSINDDELDAVISKWFE